MNELIPVNYNEDGAITVSGRLLHEFLEVATRYDIWFKRKSEYGFDENVDYIAVDQKRTTAQGNTTNYQDHAMTLDMAKEIAMLEKNAQGKQARKYFIEIEKLWNSPEMVMKRALEFADKKVKLLKIENVKKDQIIGELKPKADYVDQILKSKSLVTMNQIAKDYGMSAQKMNKKLHELGVQYKQSGQWLLYSKYHANGYTHSETIDIIRSDGGKDVTMNTKWTQKGRLFIYDLLKNECDILPVIEREEAS